VPDPRIAATFVDALTTSYDELTDDAWQTYLWWRDWDRLWAGIGAAEAQWATLYLPFRRRAPRCQSCSGAGIPRGDGGVLCWRCWVE
jgi:hypothetical protein